MLKTSRTTAIVIASAIFLSLGLAVAAWAYDTAQKDQIAAGVTVGGVDIGDRDAGQARKIIKRDVVAPLTQPVVVEFEGERYDLTPKQLDQQADIDGMIDDALEASREGSLFDRLGRYATGGEVEAALRPRVTYSEDAVHKFVADLADQINRPAVDATIIPSGDSLTPEPGQNGVELNEAKMVRLVNAEVQTPAKSRVVRAVARKTEPDVTRADLADAYPTYVTVSRSTYELRLFKDLKLVKTYPIAVGQAGLETPSGLYEVNDKQVDPVWHVPDSDWAGSLAGQDIPPGPGNPLLARWIGIYDGAGIHGTADVGSLGSAASHGCVRMAVDDVIELYDQVPLGTPIYVQ